MSLEDVKTLITVVVKEEIHPLKINNNPVQRDLARLHCIAPKALLKLKPLFPMSEKTSTTYSLLSILSGTTEIWPCNLPGEVMLEIFENLERETISCSPCPSQVYQIHLSKVYQKCTKEYTKSVDHLYFHVYSHTVGMWLCSKFCAASPP